MTPTAAGSGRRKRQTARREDGRRERPGQPNRSNSATTCRALSRPPSSTGSAAAPNSNPRARARSWSSTRVWKRRSRSAPSAASQRRRSKPKNSSPSPPPTPSTPAPAPPTTRTRKANRPRPGRRRSRRSPSPRRRRSAAGAQRPGAGPQPHGQNRQHSDRRRQSQSHRHLLLRTDLHHGRRTIEKGAKSHEKGVLADPGLPWGTYEVCASANVAGTNPPDQKKQRRRPEPDQRHGAQPRRLGKRLRKRQNMLKRRARPRRRARDDPGRARHRHRRRHGRALRPDDAGDHLDARQRPGHRPRPRDPERPHLAGQGHRKLHSACVTPKIAPVQAGSTGTCSASATPRVEGSSATVKPVLSKIALSGTSLIQTDYASLGGIPPTFSKTAMATQTLVSNVTPTPPSSSIFSYYTYSKGETGSGPERTRRDRSELGDPGQSRLHRVSTQRHPPATPASAPASRTAPCSASPPHPSNEEAGSLPCQ